MKNKNYKSQDEMVSNPQHYQSDSGLEVIDVIEAFTAGLEGVEASDTANIIKYICRWKKKNGVQDLEKVMWYTQHLINHVNRKQEPKQFKSEDITEKIKKAFNDNGITIEHIIIDEFISR